MRIALIVTLLLNGCAGDETISAFADRDAVYVLRDIDGTAFTPKATIAFPAKGEAQGAGPCNAWSADQSAVYPWFELGPIAATKTACPDLDAEGVYFAALAAARFVEVQGPVLILTSEDGAELTFNAAQP